MPSEGIAASDDEGSRHAAPRRPLLRRLHMPVGKAIALAAMPTAALMGVGFGSPLAARAEQQPENPFQDAPCVEMPDEAPTEEADEAGEADEQEEPAEEPSEEPSEEPTEPEETEEPEQSAEPPTEPAGDAVAEDPATTDEPETEPAEAEAQAEEPSAEEEGQAEGEEPAEEGPDPWDPLGLGESLEDLGESIGDFFNPGRDEQPEEPVEPEEPEESEEPRQPEEPDAPDAPEETQPPAGEEGEGEVADENREPSAEETPEVPEEEAEEGTEGEEAEEEEAADEEEAVEVETVDPFAPDAQGRLPFPCPEELSVPGTDEQTPLVLPDQPWYLDATYLTLRGLDYHGVVNVTTANGTVKQVLKFTAELIDIGDLHQIVDAPGGLRYHVGTDPGSNSTFRGGTVTMYTERLEGNLFGVIPVVFDPEHQPPLDLPIAHFTDVFVTQAGQFGGTLTMRGMTSYTTNDGPTTVG